MKLVVTVDTEEDNWGDFRPHGWTLGNIDHLPALQRLFDAYEVMPTYLITYSVAVDERSRSIMRELVASDRCEIGAHCHPWHTPPLDEGAEGQASLLCNLPTDLVQRKLRRLDESIREHIGIRPRSFRSGRWAYGTEVARGLHALGYSVDTSISPYIDWTPHHGPNYSYLSPTPFRFSPQDAFTPAPGGPMLEVPATIGFAQPDFERTNTIYQWARSLKAVPLPWISILSRLRIANRIWLSPEVSTAAEIIQLARAMAEAGQPVLNMVFHSPTLTPGLTPFVRTAQDRNQFLRRIETFLEFVRSSNMESIRLSDTASCF